MKRRYDKLFEEDQYEIIDLDFDEDDIEAYDVADVLPVVVIYKDGKEIKRLIGEKSKKDLKKIKFELEKLS
jgi:thiol-disulfide isomerase/thioredoxin